MRYGFRRSRVARADPPTVSLTPHRPLHVARRECLQRDGAAGSIGNRARGLAGRFDDEPRRFLELLESIPANELGERMLRELAGPLSCLPVVVVRGIDQLFRSPARFTSAGDLAAAAGMNVRTLYRNLEPAGFYSARALVVSARLVRAYAYLRDPGRSIKDVAAKTGYTSPWQLSQHMREMTGRTAEQVRREMSPDELIARMVEQVQQQRRQGE